MHATIVIADDSPTLRRIVDLASYQGGPRGRHGGGRHRGRAGGVPHQPDAVVLDVQMPRVSGFIAARLLKDDWQTADIPVIMLTSLDAASDRYWAGAGRRRPLPDQGLRGARARRGRSRRC